MIIFSIINIFLINIFETHVNSYLHNYYNLSRFNKACISFKYIYIYTFPYLFNFFYFRYFLNKKRKYIRKLHKNFIFPYLHFSLFSGIQFLSQKEKSSQLISYLTIQLDFDSRFKSASLFLKLNKYFYMNFCIR